MNERLYFNGELLDLLPSSNITRTLQVNDIASLENRQSNFTRTIDLPKSPNNIRILGYLGLVGNTSNIPYQKNVVDYYIDNECMIYQGYGIVSETTTHFKLNIYDGVIDLYKAIENQTFSIINLSGLTHQKDLTTVLNSWSGSTPYQYILADYNGKAKYTSTLGTTINVDYLIPSVNVAWLFNQTFSQLGMSYSGSTFQSPDFTNLWMTYPKGFYSTTPDELEFESSDFNHILNQTGFNMNNVPNTKKSGFFKFSTSSTNLMESIQDNTHFTVSGTSKYRIELSGEMKIVRKTYIPSHTSYSTSNYYSLPQQIDLWLCKNANGLNPENVIPIQKIASNLGNKSNFDPVSININFIANITHGESFSILARTANQIGNINEDNLYMVVLTQPLDMKISKVTLQNLSFQDGLQDFRIKDFLSEIVQRFGLTIFKDKYSNHYDFLTLDERIQSAQIVDWSDKFQGVVSEKYIYGTYAQNNRFKYSYSDENSQYKDGLIQINNVNLEDEKEVLKSKIYAPEKVLVNTITTAGNVYKLWDKDITENNGTQEINYKELDKRFCFLRSSNSTLPATHIGSEALITATTITQAPIESFSGLSFSDLIQKYYSSTETILNKSKIINAKFFLKPSDVANFDFKKIYYVAQLGSYFIINKINNFNGVTSTSVELLKISYLPLQSNYTIPEPTNNYYIILDSLELRSISDNKRHLRLHFTTNIPTPFDEVTVFAVTTIAGEEVGMEIPFPTLGTGYVDFDVTNFIAHEGYPDYTISLWIIKDIDSVASSNTLISTH